MWTGMDARAERSLSRSGDGEGGGNVEADAEMSVSTGGARGACGGREGTVGRSETGTKLDCWDIGARVRGRWW